LASFNFIAQKIAVLAQTGGLLPKFSDKKTGLHAIAAAIFSICD